MEYAEAMSQTPPTVTDGLAARLLEQLGAALVELTAVMPRLPTSPRGATWHSASSRTASRRRAT